MNKNKKFLLLTVLAVFSLVLAACGFGGDSSDKAKDDKKDSGSSETAKELNLVIPSEPPSLHPQLATDSTSSAILINVFEGLTRADADGQPQPAMAEKWDVSEDGLTYTFHLRDAKWTNGDPVVAGDFEYAWKWALNPENLSEYASVFYPIKGAEAYNTGAGSVDEVGIKAEDEKTLVVTLANPTAYFLELTAFKTYSPINQKVVEGKDDWYAEAGENYVTNGPYTLDTWKHSDSIVLKKNDGYWDAANVAVNTVNIGMVENEATAVTMFKNGEIDYLGSPYQTVALDAIDGFKADKSLNIDDYAAIYWYKFNTTDKVTGNANIRKALTLAIDRQGLIDNVTKGEQKPALGMVPSAISGFEEDRGYYKDNDVEGAKAALEAGMKELGIKDAKDIKINLSFNTSEAHASIAQYIQEGWSKNLGITVSLDNSEWQVYLEKLNVLDYQIGRMGWIADYNDPYTFLEMYDTAKNGNNDTGWENPKYKELLKQSVAEVDTAKRLELLKEAEAIAVSEFPVAPIYYYTNLSVKQKYVKNMGSDRLGIIQLKNVDLDAK
ncbi:peptide ABC transporter substrate-binding protein [Lysinibacillus sphaericus]|uniref:ABC transporter substrate-binding protein n=1 Tax=Lysinibacillus sphaericus TaxID=1421 RepID=A0A2S0K480_LYSSH|nr:peptide ABC transporter substrate-binding protein [Lysinibacillus sphaericus]AVK98074.1 ABC transporter substrate-binding protein [Lysinibacillus sphaericus]TKI19068.1 peptide ABC transporter substrate-binding protein [Lysinibacillus sphaericus]GEC82537.1 oligopeptide-binding protein OppA [Lysinibacillus sphaericus]SUV15980.1 oligopeptide ABC transporter binding lipoprotein [Lysinibacillus sphaericus]